MSKENLYELKNIVSSGGGKGGGGGGRSPTEDPDSLKSRAYAKVVDLLCEGEIVGLANGMKSIYFNDVPLMNEDGQYNFQEVKIETRNGTPVQPAMGLLPTVENTVNVSAEIRQGTPLTRAITNEYVDICRVSIRVPRLTQTDSDDGDIHGSSVSLKIEYKPSNLSYWVVGSNVTISGKTTSGYEREVGFRLEGKAPWNIRVTRLTPDSNSSFVQNKTFWSAYTEVMEEKLRYPYSALVGININAEQFDSIPNRAYDVKLRIIKVPSNYNPETREYNGVWDGTFKLAWSDNPAWCFYDLITNERYGVGGYIAEQSLSEGKWSLYNIGQYCDELVDDGNGGKEPRFTCNLLIQKQEEAFNVINDMASIFRGIAYWSSGQVVAAQDSPRSTIPYIFNNSNVTEEGFSYQSSALNTRYNVCYVTYNNPEDGYKQDVVYVADEDGIAEMGRIQDTKITAFGCTSKGQAYRLGKWLLFTNRFENETINFSTGMQGIALYPNDVIQIEDSLRSGKRSGGRVVSYTKGKQDIVLDAPYPFEANKAYQIEVLNVNGILSSYKIINPATETASVRLDSPVLIDLPQDTPFVIYELKKGSYWRVVDLKETDGHKYTVTAMRYVVEKYDYVEKDIAFDQQRPSDVPNLPPNPPHGLVMTSVNVATPSGLAFKMDVEWQKAGKAVKNYILDWKVGEDNWTRVNTITGLGYSIHDVAENAVVHVRIWSVDVLGRVSPNYASATAIAKGNTEKPAKVTRFGAIPEFMQIKLQWNASFSSFSKSVEVWKGMSASSLEKVATLPTPCFSYVDTGLDFAQQYYYGVRIVDHWDNISDFSYANASPIKDPSILLGQLQGSITGDQLVDDLRKPIDKIPAIEGSVTEIGGKIPTIENSISNIDQKIYDIVADVDSFREPINKIPSIETSVSDINKTVGEVVVDVERAKDLVDDLNISVSSVSEAILNQIVADEIIYEKTESNLRGIASVKESVKVVSDENKSLAQKVDVVSASSDLNAAKIQTVITAYTTADDALSSKIDVVNAKTDQNAADITKESQARADADSALAREMSTLVAGVGVGFDAAVDYYFDSGSLDGWVGSGVTLQSIDGWLATSSPSGDTAYLERTEISVQGSKYVAVRLPTRRLAGDGFNFRVDFQTSEGWHTGVSAKPVSLPIGEQGLVDVDFSLNKIWTSSTITGIRIYPFASNADLFAFFYIAIGRFAPSASQAALQDEKIARAEGDKAEAAARQLLKAEVDNNAAAIKTETEARVSADDALTKSIQTLAAKTETDKSEMLAAVEEERIARTTADEAMASRVDSVVASVELSNKDIQEQTDDLVDSILNNILVGNAANEKQQEMSHSLASAKQQITATASALEAEAKQRLELVVKVNENRGLIVSESVTRATEDEAISKRVDVVAAQTESNSASIQTETEARTTADSAISSRIDTLSANVGGNTSAIQIETETRATADLSLAKSIETLTAKTTTDKGELVAAIEEEKVVRTSADEALSSKIDVVTAQIGDVAASVQTEVVTRATEDDALSKRIDTVFSKTQDNASAIVRESEASSNRDGALAKDIQQLSAKTTTDKGEVLAAIEDERFARTSADEALSKRVDTTVAQLGDVSAAIQKETEARVTGDEALSKTIETLAAKTETDKGALLAAVEEERIARTTADESLASMVDSVVASVDLSNKEAQEQTDDLVESILNSILSSDAANDKQNEANYSLASAKQQITANATALESEAKQRLELVAKVNENRGLIVSESITRATEDGVLSARIDSVVAQTGDNTALIQTETEARTTADEAITRRLDVMSTTVGNNTSAIQTESTTRATEDESLAKQIIAVLAKTDANTAAIQTETEVRTTQDTALSNRIDTVLAQTGDNKAAIQSEVEARTAADSAISKRVDTLTASVGDNTAAIQTEATARVEGDKALTQLVNTVQSTVNGNTSSIQQNSSAIDGLKAQYTLKVTAGGKVAGMGIYADETGSNVDFLADKFRVSLPNGEGSTPVFTVGSINGKDAVGIAGDVIVDGSISTRNIVADGIHSHDFVSTKSGWSIPLNGDAEFNNATFRGKLDAATGTFAGSLAAGTLDSSAFDGVTYKYDKAGVYEITIPKKEGWSSVACKVTLLSGGGGGGGGAANHENYSAGGGGGGARVLMVRLDNLTPNTKQTVVVGAGGVGGRGDAAVAVAGTDGGVTSFMGYTSPNGKGGGGGRTHSGSGGIGGEVDGKTGAYANNPAHSYSWVVGGSGGSGDYFAGFGNGGSGGSVRRTGDNSHARESGASGTGGMAILEFFDPNGVVTNKRYSSLIKWLDSVVLVLKTEANLTTITDIPPEAR